jgi:hypothetical protein
VVEENMDQVPPAASIAATAVEASSSKAAAAAAGNDDEADKAGAGGGGKTTAVMEPQPFFPFMLHVGGVLILSWLASAFSINSILIVVIGFIYLYHVGLIVCAVIPKPYFLFSWLFLTCMYESTLLVALRTSFTIDHPFLQANLGIHTCCKQDLSCAPSPLILSKETYEYLVLGSFTI